MTREKDDGGIDSTTLFIAATAVVVAVPSMILAIITLMDRQSKRNNNDSQNEAERGQRREIQSNTEMNPMADTIHLTSIVGTGADQATSETTTQRRSENLSSSAHPSINTLNEHHYPAHELHNQTEPPPLPVRQSESMYHVHHASDRNSTESQPGTGQENGNYLHDSPVESTDCDSGFVYDKDGMVYHIGDDGGLFEGSRL